mgnify:CR=1 FL=1
MEFEITRKELILRIFRADTIPKCVYDEYNKYVIIPDYSRPYYGDLNRLYYDKENKEYLNLSDMALLYETLKIDNMILNDAEKEYLSHIIEPFRAKIKYISKTCYIYEGYEYITICVVDEPDNTESYLYFPNFKINTMYKNMIPDKEYTPDELRI